MTTANRTLLNISEDLHALDDLLSEAGGDLSDPQVEQAVDEIIAELEQDFINKTDSYAALIQELKYRSKARKEEADRLAQRAKQDAASAGFLQTKLMAVMQKHGRKSVETKRFKITVAGNGGKLPVQIHVDPSALNEEFRRIKYEADTDKIREALQQGVDVEGCSLGERGQHLRIS